MKSLGMSQYVEFEISGEKYAIPISEIHEIIRMQDITDLPNCRHYVQGVINLRGKVVAVISLPKLFSLPEREPDKYTRIVVVSHQEESVGIVVDKVNKVTTFSDIQPPPDRIVGVSGAYFTGIGMTPAGLVGVLKLEEVLLREH